jgi:hypothetical protein
MRWHICTTSRESDCVAFKAYPFAVLILMALLRVVVTASRVTQNCNYRLQDRQFRQLKPVLQASFAQNLR